MAARKFAQTTSGAGAGAGAGPGAGAGAEAVAVAVAEELCSISTAKHGGVTSEGARSWACRCATARRIGVQVGLLLDMLRAPARGRDAGNAVLLRASAPEDPSPYRPPDHEPKRGPNPMRTRLTELLGIEYPVMLAGMGGVSYSELGRRRLGGRRVRLSGGVDHGQREDGRGDRGRSGGDGQTLRRRSAHRHAGGNDGAGPADHRGRGHAPSWPGSGSPRR